ncbi:GNAT family N-acetyltransferase [Streptomyces acidiscabies]|uniref:GNAT family N-acetyltransferase n=1 Tax=Streptomyces acidiscabies TaxID=42234 RepID=A0AAP6B9E3_9ACTN|nr:GNAT family N-acetyltransferase [Streptomyces acidiscabies]MBP5937005.1 GNAT family N-acetyltransferase [Streptomyces sp. LBUM 1476]MBZ3914954.1 GNAT family N-acetyltransferase [Streptomyces acidiscabies]MDX2960596.1 GNAT family N-acetyltransferase [Streptomyces acidiscabies]MDX3020870.1 GNAT family N-acetyltransferase [Streptomyces acidiscabies]MDX3793734.1 GNAT family N-acetyltransferase [Streptomyces acidiscabies]
MIRNATVDDVADIRAMIRELAEYERAVEQATATEEQLREALFGAEPAAYALIAEDDGTGGVVGYALWFPRFSTWTGTRGLHLEDLYIRPSARGGGHGKALLAALAAICVSRGYERFEWWVLDWNEPAIAVYKSLGAEFLDEWRICRLSGAPLEELAASV